MNREKIEQSMGEFEQFTQQFTTYAPSEQLPSTSINSQKISNIPKKEKPKLRIINQQQQKASLERITNSIKKTKRNSLPNSKVIIIGNSIFRSNFESGNIDSVQKIGPNIYQITLSKQLNSTRISAWFYFAVENLKGEVKFIIKGFTKSSSLYNQGMKLCYKQAQEGKWRRGGTKISYTSTQLDDQQIKETFELQFCYFFKSTSPNSVQFAYCFPYTYSHLLKFIACHHDRMQACILGKTYEGRDIPLVTIGNHNSKYVIIISARAHPGETVGSWMMEGFIKQLLGDSDYSKHLRSAFLFKLVPMINPDGVINGNYRFSAAGYDLNRKWKNCSSKMHPEVHCFRQFIRQIHKQKQILMYIDLHGHSRQKNVFFYGCSSKGGIDSSEKPNTKPKQFPYLMSKIHSPFRYDYCSYAIQKQKQGTARILLWNQLKIDYIYTLEASFCGTEGSTNFLISDYQKIGSKLAQGICLHFWEVIKQSLQVHDYKNIQNQNKISQQINKNMSDFFSNPEIAQIEFVGNSSDSQPEAGQISQTQRKKQKNVISIQKYYKASRVIKFSQKNFEEDNLLKVKSNILNKNQNQRNKTNTNQSTIFVKQNEPQIKKMFESSLQSKNYSNSTQNQFFVRSQFLNRTINQRLKFDVIHKLTQEGQSKSRFVPEPFLIKNQNDQISYLNRNQQQKNKKKVIGFEGAQYRRVRKLAQQHNRRHYSAQTSNQPKEDDSLIRGLVGMNNLIQIERVGSKQSKQRTASFFPNTTHYGNKKRKSGSVDLQFRRHIKGVDYTSRRLYVNGIQQQVKCFGRQIL